MSAPRIVNSTDLSDKLVLIMYALTKPEGVNIREIRLRYKRKGRTHGNWGRYYWGQGIVTFCVPQPEAWTGLGAVLTRLSKRPYSGRTVEIADRYEWLALIMAHELQHAKQDQVDRIAPEQVKGMTRYLELQCEAAEVVGLELWRRLVARTPQVVAACRG